MPHVILGEQFIGNLPKGGEVASFAHSYWSHRLQMVKKFSQLHRTQEHDHSTPMQYTQFIKTYKKVLVFSVELCRSRNVRCTPSV